MITVILEVSGKGEEEEEEVVLFFLRRRCLLTILMGTDEALRQSVIT